MNEGQREKFLDHLEAFMADIAPSYRSRLEALFEEAGVDPKRPELSRRGKLELCCGCEEDFYNGHNNLGVKECWSFGDMKLILRRRVGIDECPPWTRAPERLPKCYRQKGYIFVRPKREYGRRSEARSGARGDS